MIDKKTFKKTHTGSGLRALGEAHNLAIIARANGIKSIDDFIAFIERSQAALVAAHEHRQQQLKLKGTRQPPCEGCTVAEWHTYPCGKSGWKCLASDSDTGRCNAL